MLAQLDSLLSVGVDPADFGRRALEWFERGAYTPDDSPAFGIGRTTRRALSRIAAGRPAESAGGAGEADCGNGSLMRIAPVAWAGHQLTESELIDAAHRLSSVTHAHPRIEATCALYVLALRNYLSRAEPSAALTAATTHLTRAYAGLADTAHADELDLVLAWEKRAGTGYVVDCFWTAWTASSAATSYREAVELAVRAGNDTDTTAAVCGALAGTRFGQSHIPPDWLQRLAGRRLAEALVDRLRGQPEPVES